MKATYFKEKLELKKSPSFSTAILVSPQLRGKQKFLPEEQSGGIVRAQ